MGVTDEEKQFINGLPKARLAKQTAVVSKGGLWRMKTDPGGSLARFEDRRAHVTVAHGRIKELEAALRDAETACMFANGNMDHYGTRRDVDKALVVIREVLSKGEPK